MTVTPVPTHESALDPSCALRWLLTRGHDKITCEIHVTPERAFEVGFFPHWDLSQAVLARFDHPTAALARHADVVRQLRDAGWTVADHRPGVPLAPAA